MSFITSSDPKRGKLHGRSKSVGFYQRAPSIYWDELTATFCLKQKPKIWRTKRNSLDKWTEEEKRKVIEYFLGDFYKQEQMKIKKGNKQHRSTLSSRTIDSLRNFQRELNTEGLLIDKNVSIIEYW